MLRVGLLEENIKSIYAIMNYTENKQTSGLNIHIDFKTKEQLLIQCIGNVYMRFRLL